MPTSAELIKNITSTESASLMSMLEHSSAMVLIKDSRDQTVWTNLSTDFETVLAEGEAIEDLIGRSPSEWLWFIPKDKYEKIDQEILTTGKPRVNMTEIVREKNNTGEQHILRIDKLPFMNKDMKPIGVITYIINISKTLNATLTHYANEIEYLNLRCAVNTVLSELKK